MTDKHKDTREKEDTGFLQDIVEMCIGNPRFLMHLGILSLGLGLGIGGM